MNYIIDGHNLISKIPGLSLSMPDDEEQLITLLQNYAEHAPGRPYSDRAAEILGRWPDRPLPARSGRLEVYFDGAPPGQARVSKLGRVWAHFVQKSSSADEAIRVRLRRMGQSARSWVVVTSDRTVQAAAREMHAQVMSADEFAGRLLASLQQRTRQSENPADQPLSQAEIDEWLRIFKERKPAK